MLQLKNRFVEQFGYSSSECINFVHFAELELDFAEVLLHSLLPLTVVPSEFFHSTLELLASSLQHKLFDTFHDDVEVPHFFEVVDHPCYCLFVEGGKH